MSSTRTLLVDSSYLLKRSFDGAKESYTKAGFMGGLYGFLTTVRMLVRDYQINKVVLMWDGENSGVYRHQIDHNYKANRKSKSWYDKIELTDDEIRREKEKDASILAQRKRVQAYAEELYFRQVEIAEIEGDDLIAAYTIKNSKKEEIILFTNDRDFLQLLEYGIKIRLHTNKTLLSAGNFFLHYPYHYKNALTLKIICGDTSDNIKGIKGLQEKTLFNYFPELSKKHMTVRELCQLADEFNKTRLKEKKKPIAALKNLVEGVERLKLNHQLINLSKPFLNDEAIESLAQLEEPLEDKDRGQSNLYKLMEQDDFLSLYSNYGKFVDYIEPFSTVISKEKELFRVYQKNN